MRRYEQIRGGVWEGWLCQLRRDRDRVLGIIQWDGRACTPEEGMFSCKRHEGNVHGPWFRLRDSLLSLLFPLPLTSTFLLLTLTPSVFLTVSKCSRKDSNLDSTQFSSSSETVYWVKVFVIFLSFVVLLWIDQVNGHGKIGLHFETQVCTSIALLFEHNNIQASLTETRLYLHEYYCVWMQIKWHKYVSWSTSTVT